MSSQPFEIKAAQHPRCAAAQEDRQEGVDLSAPENPKTTPGDSNHHHYKSCLGSFAVVTQSYTSTASWCSKLILVKSWCHCHAQYMGLDAVGGVRGVVMECQTTVKSPHTVFNSFLAGHHHLSSPWALLFPHLELWLSLGRGWGAMIDMHPGTVLQRRPLYIRELERFCSACTLRYHVCKRNMYSHQMLHPNDGDIQEQRVLTRGFENRLATRRSVICCGISKAKQFPTCWW